MHPLHNFHKRKQKAPRDQRGAYIIANEIFSIHQQYLPPADIWIHLHQVPICVFMLLFTSHLFIADAKL